MDFRSMVYAILFVLSGLVMVLTITLAIEGVKCKIIKPDTLVIAGIGFGLWLLYLVR